MIPARSRRRPEPAVDPDDGRQAAEEPRDLREQAMRLHPAVDWMRMSESAVRRALGYLPAHSLQGREYAAGRQAREDGEPLPASASMAFRLGWSHGRPPKPRRRRWRSRPAASMHSAGGGGA